MTSPFARIPGAPPLLYGHRGTRRGAPENTLRAMRLALQQGADGIELDVRLCKSGEVIVLHDPDLARVAGVALAAADASLEELRAYDLGGGERVPTLDDALDLVLGAQRLLNIELKADVPDPAALVRAVAARLAARSASERERVLCSSFSAEVCRALSAALPGAAVAFLFERDAPALPPGCSAVHPRADLASPDRIAHWHDRGLIVNAWTVNDPDRARALDAAALDGIVSDDIPLVRGRPSPAG